MIGTPGNMHLMDKLNLISDENRTAPDRITTTVAWWWDGRGTVVTKRSKVLRRLKIVVAVGNGERAIVASSIID